MNREQVSRAEPFSAAEPVRALSDAASCQPSMGKIIRTQDAHCAKGAHVFFEGTKGHWVVTLQWGLGVGVGCPGLPAIGWEQIMIF